jgi:hypothetical protein
VGAAAIGVHHPAVTNPNARVGPRNCRMPRSPTLGLAGASYRSGASIKLGTTAPGRPVCLPSRRAGAERPVRSRGASGAPEPRLPEPESMAQTAK